ncbi:MAG: hypothetical protein U5K00_08165 [Melioribacteraceae bacterium]|nr:hypothetical protein [Melioribacteraceae bacterium]
MKPADTHVTPNHIKPEWYFYGVYSLLKFPVKLGIYLITVFIIVGTFWPFIDEYIRTKWPKIKVIISSEVYALFSFCFSTVYEMFVY